MHKIGFGSVVPCVALLTACSAAAPHPSRSQLLERGAYLVKVADCGGCHSGPDAYDRLDGAGKGFEVPDVGVFYAPNLTPHPTAGIGRWTEAQIVRALRTGEIPDGRMLSPAMPWKRAYSNFTDEDAGAIAAYLKSLTPSDHVTPGPATPATAPYPYRTISVPKGTSPS